MSQIKSYTTNFSMKIPEFNIATWHDAMEYNFTLIDALLGNFFEANKFKGPWLIVTGYQTDDIVYITDEDDQYVGKIFKVLQNHVSGNTKFETFYAAHPEYYEEYADLNGVLNYFTIAKDYAIKMDGKVVENGVPIDYSAKYYANESANSATLADGYKSDAFNYKIDAESAKNSAEGYATAAQGYMNNAKQHRDDAEDFKNQASTSATNAELCKDDAETAANNASSNANNAQTSETNAATSALNASNSATAAYNSEVAAQTARDDAKVWAVGIPAEPNEHSARYWAQLAATYCVQPDWEQADDTAVDYIKNKPLSLIAQISTNQNNIGNLTNLTTSDKNDLVSAINSEVSRAINSEDALGGDLVSERNMRIAQDNALYGVIIDEEDRATTVEGKLANLNTTNKTNLVAAINETFSLIPSLSGYATEQWVTNQGYITGITSAMVTTALGYTPYNSTNPNGYQANVLEGVQVNGTDLTITSKKVNVSVPTQASDINAQPTLVSGTNIKTVNGNSLLGSGNLAISGLPSQTSQSGKFLTTNGTSASWANIPTEIPSQSGQNGKFLTTNGSSVSWATVNALPSQTGNSGKYLTTNGTSASWGEISEYTAQEVETLWGSL